MKPFFTLLKESSSKVMVKSKRKMLHVSKEYSALAIFVIFILLVSAFAFSPQTGGTPRAISNAYVPTAISVSSLPIGGAGLTTNVGTWLDAITWLQNNAKSTDVCVMWWDYGNWLADLANVTSLADNTTVNSTQIENIGFTFMGTENQSLAMLSTYGQDRVKYIAIFEVLYVGETSQGSNQYYAIPAGYGDEGKWVWMARISGQGKERLINQGFISAADAWTNETSFGESSATTGRWEWNNRGLNCTVAELLSFAENQYAARMTQMGITVQATSTATAPTYFKEAHFSGIDTLPMTYSGLVPIIAIYEIDWAAYNADNP